MGKNLVEKQIQYWVAAYLDPEMVVHGVVDGDVKRIFAVTQLPS